MDDMSNLIKQLSATIEKDGIPDNLKDIINNFNNSSTDSSTTEANSNKSTSTDSASTGQNSANSFANFDIETILKMKNIIDGLNAKDDPRANLLRSLKPYLNDSRKSKIDQYVQFLNMSKVFEMMKKNNSSEKEGKNT